MKKSSSLRNELGYFIIPEYIYGLFSGIIAICILLIIYKGITFTLADHQIRAYDIIWLCLVFLLSYYSLRNKKDDRRLYLSLAFVLMVFEIHDSLSALQIFTYGYIRYFDLIQLVTAPITLSIYSRDLTIAGVCFYIIRSDLKRNWKAFSLIPFQVGLWIWMVSQPFDCSFLAPLNLTLDFLPYYLMIRPKGHTP